MLMEQELSDEIIRCCMEIHQDVGFGLLEKVYRNGIFYDLKSLGRTVVMEKNYKIFRNNRLLGNYFADLVIENKIIVEVKSTTSLTPGMEAQLIHYLRISGIRVGYLVNFKHERFDWIRVVI